MATGQQLKSTESLLPDVITHKTVWRLAAPIIIGHISIPLLGLVDTAVVGHLPGPEPLGALALGNLIFSYVYWGFGFLRMGTTGLTAQAYGAFDAAQLRAWLQRALFLGSGIGFTLLILHRPILRLSLWVVDATPEVELLCSRYYFARIWGAPAVLCNTAIIGWLLGVHDTRKVLWLQLWMNGLNMALDVAIVYGLGFGVAGVGLATAFSEITACALGFWMVRQKLRELVAADTERAKLLDLTRLKRLIGINRDLFIRTLSLITAYALLTAQGARLGDTILAANAILLNFQTLASFGLDGFAHAVEALVGKAIGRNNATMYRDSVHTSTRLAVGVALIFTVAYAVGGSWLIDMLSNDEAVVTTARHYLVWLVLSPLISVWSYQLDGIFSGATRSAEMRNSMVMALVVYVGLVWALMPRFANHGLWLAFLIFMTLRAVTLGSRFRRLPMFESQH